MSGCPERDILERLEAGELADEQVDQLLPHVEQCPSCAQALEHLRKENLDSRILRRAVQESQGTESVLSHEEEGCAAESANGDADWNIPDYERVRMCGEGAFGTVWAVRDRVGVHRALKTIDLARLAAANVSCRELTALEAYCRHVEPHANLINISHVGVHENLLYYTMELADDDHTRRPVRGEIPAGYRPLTLQQVMSGRPVSVDTGIEVVLRLLRGLCNLHKVGLAHRDIKPANIVFVEGQPKVSDIGMITTTTATPSQVGTPDYMPPDGQMDLTADTYAMGRILYELIVGEWDEDAPHVPNGVCNARGQWDASEIGQVLATACAASAKDRFTHAERMIEQIEACRRGVYDSLFAELDRGPRPTAERRHAAYVPLFVAGINALPWILGLVLAIVLAQKLL